MKKLSKKGVSLIEALVVLVLITIAIVGVYRIYSESNKLTESNENRLAAIQIAREGIEAVANIRDTNWLKLAADPDNCWNAIDYDKSCIGSTTNGKIDEARYIVYLEDNTWKLKNKSVTPPYEYTNLQYKKKFGVVENNGFYEQFTSDLTSAQVNKSDLFTREIKIKYLDASHVFPKTQMEVTSIVQWADNNIGQIRKIELKQVLTNWKKKN